MRGPFQYRGIPQSKPSLHGRISNLPRRPSVPPSVPSQPYFSILEGTTAHPKRPRFQRTPSIYQWETRSKEGKQLMWTQHAGSTRIPIQLSRPRPPFQLMIFLLEAVLPYPCGSHRAGARPGLSSTLFSHRGASQERRQKELERSAFPGTGGAHHPRISEGSQQVRDSKLTPEPLLWLLRK